MKKIVDNYAPMKKVAAGFLAAAAVYLAHRYLSLDLGSEQTAAAIQAAIGPVVAWAVKDPNMKRALDVAEKAIEAGAKPDSYGTGEAGA